LAISAGVKIRYSLEPKPLGTGGPIAFVNDGDKILIDLNAKKLDLLVDDEVLEKRKKEMAATILSRTRCSREVCENG
jgi:dihydroxyacid dehydratase/phosphogluconate dehydratase